MSYPVALDQHYKASHKSVVTLQKIFLYKKGTFFFVPWINDAPYAAKLTFIICFNCINA